MLPSCSYSLHAQHWGQRLYFESSLSFFSSILTSNKVQVYSRLTNGISYGYVFCFDLMASIRTMMQSAVGNGYKSNRIFSLFLASPRVIPKLTLRFVFNQLPVTVTVTVIAFCFVHHGLVAVCM
jgi:hypothetical protein